MFAITLPAQRRALRSDLNRRLNDGLRRARASGHSVLVSLTGHCPGSSAPTETVLASRRPSDQWFCLEQPEREEMAVCGLGCAKEITADGPNRFKTLAERWRDLVREALADEVVGPPGVGVTAVGGFAFAANGGRGHRWTGFPSASLTVPEVSLARRAGETWITLNALVAPDDTVQDVQHRIERRLEELHSRPLPLLDPDPLGRFRVSSPIPPAHYEESVVRAVERIKAGELEKIVLAREVEVQAPAPYDPAAILGVLREGFPSCYIYAMGRGGRTFLGASPELLVRREGSRATSVALAGSTGRSADPAVDDHLGERLMRSDKDRHENAIVARRIARALAPHSVWVTVAPDPAVIRVANIQHLAAPIRAQLASPMSAVELAGVLHPTPAVGGEPWKVAEPLIPALEGFDRGWYAGPVGWVDQTGDGEFCVALRCALLNGPEATCFAGCGIVADSNPVAELAETETKLQALLPILAG
ncbi:MAG TPA: isochorismate synthase [Solirubrobacteraceae bacterium]|nr:isochorismate synthase [Solirubrobacteraceae bacterium]